MFALRFAAYLRRPSILLLRSSSLSTAPRPSHNTRLDLDQLLERLDGEAHRRGRLNPGLVRGAMRKAAVELNSISSTQALLLIRCTGSLLVSELPRQRQQVLEHMMTVFKQKQVPFDVTHYNSYMRVSLQNTSFFDPMKILEEMRVAQITPNLTSFRLLIECYARQGRSDEIQKILNEMKTANFNIEPLTLTHLLGSYAQNGNVERVESLFHLFNELDLKPISETYEQFIIGYLRQGQIDQAKDYFVSHASKMDNESLFRLIVKCAQCQQKDLFQLVINAIDQNSLADICVSLLDIERNREREKSFLCFQVQYILCATELLDARLDDYAFLLVDSFPKRDETLRFDVINLTMLNLLKLRLPAEHFRPFSALTLDEINHQLDSSINYQCERQSVSAAHLTHFRENVLKRIEHFPEKKDRWLVVHQLLHHAYQNYIPLAYIYAIYDCLRAHDYEYRPHYMRPVLVKLQRIYANDPTEMVNQIRQLLDYLQKNFSINYDEETIELLIEHFFDQCHLAPLEIDTIFKKVNIRVSDYWTQLYSSTLKRLDGDLLNSLKVFLNVNRNFRFEYTPVVREQTTQAMQSWINRLSVNEENRTDEELFNHLKDLIDFVEVVNKRFVKNPTEVQNLNDQVLAGIVHWFSSKEQPRPTDFLERIVQLFEQRGKSIPVSDGTREKVYRQLGKDTQCQN